MKLQKIRVRGGKFRAKEWLKAKETDMLTLGGQLKLVREPENQHDPNAIKVLTLNDWHIGYVAADQAWKFARRMDDGAVVHSCTVTKLDEWALDAQLDLRGGWSGIRKDAAARAQSGEEIPDDDIPF